MALIMVWGDVSNHVTGRPGVSFKLLADRRAEYFSLK